MSFGTFLKRRLANTYGAPLLHARAPTQDSTSRGTTRCVRTSFPAHSLDSRARTLSSSSPKPRAVEINKNRWIAGRRRRGCPASLRASFHPRSKYSFRLSSDEKLDTVLTSSPPLPNRETRVQARRQNDKNTKESVITSSDKTRVSKNLL